MEPGAWPAIEMADVRGTGITRAIEVLAFLSGLELARLVCLTIPAAEAAATWAAQQVDALQCSPDAQL
jgi:hypothetical protein